MLATSPVKVKANVRKPVKQQNNNYEQDLNNGVNRHLRTNCRTQTLYEHEFRKEVGDSDVDYKTIFKA